eukprot:scaffold4498_cov117-Cylindrotheca_fusiformis.AAC.3
MAVVLRLLEDKPIVPPESVALRYNGPSNPNEAITVPSCSIIMEVIVDEDEELSAPATTDSEDEDDVLEYEVQVQQQPAKQQQGYDWPS